MDFQSKGMPDVRENLFGGEGAVKVWNLMPQQSPPFTAVLGCELAAGGHVGPHTQQEYAENIVGIEGQGNAAVNGNPFRLHPGDVVYLPFGAVLEIINNNQEQTLQYMIIKGANVQ